MRRNFDPQGVYTHENRAAFPVTGKAGFLYRDKEENALYIYEDGEYRPFKDVSGGGGGGGGTEDHEALDNLYPEDLNGETHNHVSDDELERIRAIVNPPANIEDDPTQQSYVSAGHEELRQLLPPGGAKGQHYHLSKELYDIIINIFKPPDEPTDPRGHELLDWLLPEGLQPGDHYHLTRALYEALSAQGPEKPTIYVPAERQTDVAVMPFCNFKASYNHPLGKALRNFEVQVCVNGDWGTVTTVNFTNVTNPDWSFNCDNPEVWPDPPTDGNAV
jgi:hypothetical protein